MGRTSGLQGAFSIGSPRLRVGTETAELPPVSKEFDGAMPSFDALDVPCRALELLAGQRTRGAWPVAGVIECFRRVDTDPGADVGRTAGIQRTVDSDDVEGATETFAAGTHRQPGRRAAELGHKTWVRRADDDSSPAAHAVTAWLSSNGRENDAGLAIADRSRRCRHP